MDEGVADDSLNDTRQRFIGPLLAQGGHHAEIMPEATKVPSIRCTGESRELPDLPDDRGQLDVHRMLNIRQVRAYENRNL